MDVYLKGFEVAFTKVKFEVNKKTIKIICYIRV